MVVLEVVAMTTATMLQPKMKFYSNRVRNSGYVYLDRRHVLQIPKVSCCKLFQMSLIPVVLDSERFATRHEQNAILKQKFYVSCGFVLFAILLK